MMDFEKELKTAKECAILLGKKYNINESDENLLMIYIIAKLTISNICLCEFDLDDSKLFNEYLVEENLEDSWSSGKGKTKPIDNNILNRDLLLRCYRRLQRINGKMNCQKRLLLRLKSFEDYWFSLSKEETEIIELYLKARIAIIYKSLYYSFDDCDLFYVGFFSVKQKLFEMAAEEGAN